jgi:hypothetical protein
MRDRFTDDEVLADDFMEKVKEVVRVMKPLVRLWVARLEYWHADCKG